MTKITIYHTNDMHNSVVAINALSRIQKDDSTLILDSGDALAGSNTVFKLSEQILREMKRVGYDAMAMGNREFNYLRWVLKIRSAEADFPILCANLKDLEGEAEKYFHRYIIKNASNLKVGITGFTPVQYGDKSLWKSIFRFKFLNPLETITNLIKEIRDRVDLFIVLSHLGLEHDKKIAELTDGINLILGGHSHTTLKKPLQIKDTYIFQAETHGRSFGKIELLFQDNTIENLTYQLVIPSFI